MEGGDRENAILEEILQEDISNWLGMARRHQEWRSSVDGESQRTVSVPVPQLRENMQCSLSNSGRRWRSYSAAGQE